MADIKKYTKWVGILLLWWVVFPVIISTLLSLVSAKELVLALVATVMRKKKPLVVRTPEDRFRGLEKLGYTFKPNYVELPIGGGKTLPRVHYVDEGPRDAQETIVCLHGVPSWSFLYRSMVPVLVKAGYRVICLDFIGFGKSDKYTYADMYTQELHTLTLRLLLDHLKVQNVTLVCQEWGGPTGLSVVKDMPNVFSRLVIMNTGLPIGTEFSLTYFRYIIPFLIWQNLVGLFSTRLPIYYIFKYGLQHHSKEILEAYTAPFPSGSYKAGAAKWPLMVPLSTRTPVAGDLQATRDFLANRWKRPALVMFSDKDSFTRGMQKVFLTLMPHATTKTVTGAGHFLQEDKGEELATHISSFIDGKL